MIYEYKLACIEAGLSEEQIREISQVFDTEYKRNDYDEKKRRKYGMEILHLDGMLGADGEAGTDEDREFLMTCFAYENDYIKRLSQKYGMTGSAVRWKKEQLLKKLKKRFFDQQ